MQHSGQCSQRHRGLFWLYSIFQWVCVRWLMPCYQLYPVKLEKQKSSLKTPYLMSKNSNTRNVMHLHWCKVGVHVERQTYLKGKPGKPCQVQKVRSPLPQHQLWCHAANRVKWRDTLACCASLINLNKVIYPANFWDREQQQQCSLLTERINVSG